MAGEIEEPFGIGLQGGFFHSGSISFGRFETESLCWERRSSFSHNRYLEEVEKCSKPGSVTQKKAFFEAHYRKKGVNLGENGIEHQTNDNDVSENTGYEEEIENVNIQYDEAPHCEGESLEESFDEPILDASCNFTTDEANNAIIGSSHSMDNKLDIKMEDKLEENTDDLNRISISEVSPNDCEVEKVCDASQEHQSPKKKSAPRNEYVKQSEMREVPTVKIITPGKALKVLENKQTKTIDKKTSKSSIRDVCKINKTQKYEIASKTISVNTILRKEKEPRNKKVEHKSSTSNKISSRVNPSVAINRGIKESRSSLNFKSDEPAQRTKHLVEKKIHSKAVTEIPKSQAKSEGDSEAEIKHLHKNLRLKATPIPSLYRRALPGPDKNKVGRNQPIFARVPLRKPGQPQISKSTSRHPIVTSDISSEITYTNHSSGEKILNMLKNKVKERNKISPAPKNLSKAQDKH